MMMNDFMNAATKPLVLKSGFLCLGIQLVLHAVCEYVLPSGPWTKLPSFTAHQVLALPLMTYVSYQGCNLWFSSTEPASAEGRITDLFQEGVELAEVVFGFLLYWDIPVSIATPAKQDTLMLAHHIGMLFVAGVVMGNFCASSESRGSYYAPFFLGVIESSTIPLCYVDVFHKKYKYWYNYMNDNKDNTLGKVLAGINDVSRVCFALIFLAFRFFYFPYVAFGNCLQDFWLMANQESDSALLGIFVACLLFTGLQLYWGFLIIGQLRKALGLSSSSGESDKKNK
jgi:hypothetical protein